LNKVIKRTSQFERDVRKLQRQGKNLEKLKRIPRNLVEGERLPDKYRDHVLVGQYKGTRECHIEPDWLLIYELAEQEVILIRTGLIYDKL